MRLRPGADPAITRTLSMMVDTAEPQRGRWTIVAPRQLADQLMRFLIDSIGGESIDDFWLVTPEGTGQSRGTGLMRLLKALTD
jgi:hypothetical protein